MRLKLKTKKEDLQTIFESVLDVLSVALNRGITKNILYDLKKENHIERGYLWMYQKNGSCSDFINFDRVDLKPCMNDYWLNVRGKSETEIIFDLNFRYSRSKESAEDLFSKVLIFLFGGNIEPVE